MYWHRFIELTSENPAQAVGYLQTDVSDVIDHKDPNEREKVKLLLTL